MESMGNSDVKRLLPPALGPLYLDIWVDEGFTIFLNAGHLPQDTEYDGQLTSSF